MSKDPPAVQSRAKALAATQETQYWLVATHDELAQLLDGHVPVTMRAMILGLIKRDPAETRQAYLARIDDALAARAAEHDA